MAAQRARSERSSPLQPRLLNPSHKSRKGQHFSCLAYRGETFGLFDCVAMMSAGGRKRREFLGVITDLFEDADGMWFQTRWLEPVTQLGPGARFKPELFGEGVDEQYPQPVECITRLIFRKAVYEHSIKGVTFAVRMKAFQAAAERAHHSSAAQLKQEQTAAAGGSDSDSDARPPQERKRARWGHKARTTTTTTATATSTPVQRRVTAPATSTSRPGRTALLGKGAKAQRAKAATAKRSGGDDDSDDDDDDSESSSDSGSGVGTRKRQLMVSEVFSNLDPDLATGAHTGMLVDGFFIEELEEDDHSGTTCQPVPHVETTDAKPTAHDLSAPGAPAECAAPAATSTVVRHTRAVHTHERPLRSEGHLRPVPLRSARSDVSTSTSMSASDATASPSAAQ